MNHVLIAPDSFKEALPADAVAAAIAAGLLSTAPHARLTLCPLSDGGEGAGLVLASALRAHARREEVQDALGRPVTARWWRTTDDVAIVELAEAAGLQQLAPSERDPTRTHTFGVGQLLRSALESGCRRLLLCIGGSATVDGGAACLQALGWRLLDRDGRTLHAPLAGRGLSDVWQLAAPDPPLTTPCDVLCDVTNPLTGRHGAARVFGPQKNANLQQVARLERNLELWADALARSTGVRVHDTPRGGASGGIAAALHAVCGAQLLPGFDFIAQAVGLAERVRAADLIITGEGRLDATSAAGKVVGGVARLAAEAGKPCVAIVGATMPGDSAGRDRLRADLGLAALDVITPPEQPLPLALATTAEHLTSAAQRVAHAFLKPGLGAC